MSPNLQLINGFVDSTEGGQYGDGGNYMSANELRKHIDEMKDAFDQVVKAATEPVQNDIKSEFSELQNLINNKLNNIETKIALFGDDLKDNTEDIKQIKAALRGKYNEEPTLFLLDTLCGALNSVRWEDNNNRR